MPRIEVGDTVVIKCEVTKLVGDLIAVHIPGVGTPVSVYESSIFSVEKKLSAPKRPTMPKGWKPPRDVGD
ncbi:hypothetical protein [Aminobacter sp. BE322]|uniref:hypothetical protein n=1 Tax=unclassified Aminobacter TaxID=2644704 RepID=UPI003D1D140A